MDDGIEKRKYQTLLEYVMYNFYVSCPYNQVDGSDLTNLEVLAIFIHHSTSNNFRNLFIHLGIFI